MHTARFLIIGTVAALGVGLVAAPASAAPTSDTVVTFEITAGTLDIVSPATADLLTGASGAVIAGQMGPVTVTDGRAATDASWVGSVISGAFTTGGATPTETVLANLVNYWSGPTTATTGDGTFTPGQPAVGAATPIDTLKPAMTHAGGTGNNSATWNPTLRINVPLANVAGIYTGTVTHSVA